LDRSDYAYAGPTLSNTEGTGQWTAGDPFIGVAVSYWSSSAYVPTPATAWFVNVSAGTVVFVARTSTSVYVWPVRGE
jgi:hypothetical protein